MIDLPPTTEMLRTALPVFRCVHCFRRHEDHRSLTLRCPDLEGGTFEAIPYESHDGFIP